MIVIYWMEEAYCTKKNFLIPTRNIKHFISLICGLKCWSKKVSLPYWNQQWSSSLQSETFFQSSYGQRQTFLFHILNILNKHEYHHHHQGHRGHIIIIIAVNISRGELDTSFVDLNMSSRLSDKNTAVHCCKILFDKNTAALELESKIFESLFQRRMLKAP